MAKGLLTFKNGGDVKSSSKKSSKKKSSSSKSSSSKSESESNSTNNPPSSSPPSPPTVPSSSSSSSSTSVSAPSAATKTLGSGLISHSGTVLTSTPPTNFTSLTPGDAVILKNPSTKKDEMRVIRLIVSSTSVLISSAFTFPGASGCKWWYIQPPRVKKTAADIASETSMNFAVESDMASGATKNGYMEYRMPTKSGNYTIVKERVGENVSREDMLDMRKKIKGDKYCN